jgi:predicted RNA binding protein YcfA (HicA-like mRNA interferase family)
LANLPVLRPPQVVALRGSHRQFRHPDGRSTTVPFHADRDVSPTLLRKTAADIHLSVDESLALH